MKIEYCPDDCNYRDKRIRYCGFCLKKILEERKKEKEDLEAALKKGRLESAASGKPDASGKDGE